MIDKAAMSRCLDFAKRCFGDARRHVSAAVTFCRGLSLQTMHTVLGGLVVVAGAAALVVSQGVASPTSGGGYELIARFGSIDGVGKGTKVLLTGIKVGEVVRIGYDPKRQRAVVHMTIRSDIEIPLDTVAMIVSDGLMGGKYIKLQPGGDTEMMHDGDTFEYVQDSIIFEEILEKVILNAEQKRKEQQQEEKQEQQEKQEKKIQKKPSPDEARQEDLFEIAARISRELKREGTR